MSDFDFTMGDRPEPNNRYASALHHQGFQEPTDGPPFRNPAGWHGGQVDQTGGMVMVRRWYTVPAIDRIHERRPGRHHEYEVAYGDNPGVSISRYAWRGDEFRDGRGAYIFDEVVESVSVPENTDEAKARAALRLMKKHSDKTA